MASTLALASCTGSDMPAQDPEDPGAAPITQSEVDAVRNAFLQSMTEGNPAAAAELYTDDAVFHLADGTKVQGRADIEEHLMASGGGMSDVSITPGHTETGPSLAYETGTFSATVTSDDGAQAPASGTHLVVMERQPDGSLEIVQDAEWADPAGDGGDAME